MKDIQTRLDSWTVPGKLFTPAEENAVSCFACANRCLIRPGKRGTCKVRWNQDGVLYVPREYVAAVQIDPIEKKPFSHLYPGAQALTFGMLGCDFHCDFCQNWLTSQTLCDPRAADGFQYVRSITARQLVEYAVRGHADLMVSSYNEPLITSEWAVEIFTLANQAGMRCAYVSNGNATPEVLDFLRPHLVAYKIDLKTMQDRHYRSLGGRLQNILDTIVYARKIGLWVEVVTLVIPEFNDSSDELWETARFLASVSPDIPWHVTAFHPDYQHLNAPPTPAETLQRAAEIGQEAGLHFVYAGNLPGRVGNLEDTHCPHCSTRLIQRRGYAILDYKITAGGACPKCGTAIAGIWPEDPRRVLIGGAGWPRPIPYSS